MASPEPTFETTAAHRYFSATCFNEFWKLLSDEDRTPDQDDRLVALGHASHYHWLERGDCAQDKLVIAQWMLARIYAAVERPEPGAHHARRAYAMAVDGGLSPFLQGCAHEATARVAHVAGRLAQRDAHLERARALAADLVDGERKVLLADVDEVAAWCAAAT